MTTYDEMRQAGAAESQEPVFELRASDPLAAGLTRLWVFLKTQDFEAAIVHFALLCGQPPGELEGGAITEALGRVEAMEAWQQKHRKCRDCGCTDDRACMTATGPCHWVERDLCSNCADGARLDAAIKESINPSVPKVADMNAGELGASGIPGDG